MNKWVLFLTLCFNINHACLGVANFVLNMVLSTDSFKKRQFTNIEQQLIELKKKQKNNEIDVNKYDKKVIKLMWTCVGMFDDEEMQNLFPMLPMITEPEKSWERSDEQNHSEDSDS